MRCRLHNSPTLLGRIAQVSGSAITARMSATLSSGLSIIEGNVYRIGQVGSFVRIPLGYLDLVGVVSEIGAGAVPESIAAQDLDDFRWMKIQLIGERIGNDFERGIGQFPNINDEVHVLTERDLLSLYGNRNAGNVPVGRLASSESIECLIDIDKLVTRHSAIMGSTGSGKSTTVASLVRSISAQKNRFDNARILILDIHGEYYSALSDVANVFRVNPFKGQTELHIPYWALSTSDVAEFLFGGISDDKLQYIRDKIVDLKLDYISRVPLAGIDKNSLTADAPVPYSLKKLWYDLVNEELKTLEGEQRDKPALVAQGDADNLIVPQYKPHGLGAKGPFINTKAPGLKKNLEKLRSRLLDHSYDFLLHPGSWEPSLDGTTNADLDALLKSWLGHDKSVTILDLSGVPSEVLVRLIGSLLTLVYEALFWSRDKSEGGVNRPLLLVMEEAHRYLRQEGGGTAKEIVGRIVKEGRKYGIGAMVVSQRPSEVDETILSQCGTQITLRLSNPSDRSRIKGTLPDSLGGLMDMLPTLRTGEAIITGEAAHLPMRTRIYLPPAEHRPDSQDPSVTAAWQNQRIPENYGQVMAAWRAQSSRKVTNPVKIERVPVKEDRINL